MKIQLEATKKSNKNGFINDLTLELKKHKKDSFEYKIISELIRAAKAKP
jgi:hypothetical protein